MTTYREVFWVGGVGGLAGYADSLLSGPGAVSVFLATGVGSIIGLFVNRAISQYDASSIVKRNARNPTIFVAVLFVCISVVNGAIGSLLFAQMASTNLVDPAMVFTSIIITLSGMAPSSVMAVQIAETRQVSRLVTKYTMRALAGIVVTWFFFYWMAEAASKPIFTWGWLMFSWYSANAAVIGVQEKQL